MTRVRLYAHPFAGAEQVFDAPSIGEWLLAHYGAAPSVGVSIYKGEPSLEADVTGDVKALLANDAPEYVVLEFPGDPYSWSALSVVKFFFFAAVLAYSLTAEGPAMPSNVNRSQQSPNNALGSRENQVRFMQRVEDIFGTVKSIPSLMMPTYNKYIDNTKFEYGYYCISRGYIDAVEISDGNSLIENIGSASAAVYWPFTSPNSGDAPVIQIGDPIIDKVLTVARSVEVDGITLKALNELTLESGAPYFFIQNTSGKDEIQQLEKAPNFISILNSGDVLHIVRGYRVDLLSILVNASGNTFTATSSGDTFAGYATVGATVNVHGYDSTNDGTYTVIAVSGQVMTVSPPLSTVSNYYSDFRFNVAYEEDRTIETVTDGFVTLTGTSVYPIPTGTIAEPIPPQEAATITVVGYTPNEWTDWVTLPSPDRAEVWFNVLAPNGLYKDDGGRSAVMVDFEAEVQRLDASSLAPITPTESVMGTITGAVADERADTIEHLTAWVGPARIRMRRTSNHDFEFQGTVSDEIKWADLYSVSYVTKPDFGNKTTIHTVTKATERSTAVKQRQLNCIASRLLPLFNGSSFSGAFDSTGLHVSGAISQTSKVVDIIAAVSLDPKIGNRSLANEIDMAQIFGVQQQLDAWTESAGQFNYTFDSDNMSFEETVMAIANAAFCTAYRQNGKIRFALDRHQSASTALFTHRNKKPRSESITRSFSADGDFDGVEFLYSDPDTAQTETIQLPLSGNYSKLKKFEIPGIRNFTQAWYRANREYNKLLGRRLTIETTTTLDARALLPNARIDIVDNTRFQAYDGEVVAQAGLMLTLSQAVQFSAGELHSMVLMRRDGSVQSIPVSPGPSSRQVVIAYAPSEAIVTTQGATGIRTIYSIASDSARQAMACLVTEIDLSDGQYATVRATNYSEKFYQADSQPVPDKAEIIN